MGTLKTLRSKTLQNHDPTVLLARGATARWVSANTPLSCLTTEEVDKDLRHMQAYANAVTSYRQQYYLQQTNAVDLPPHTTTTTSAAPPTMASTTLRPHNATTTASGHVIMPITLDPDEEARQQLLRKKIALAEQVREELEQQYVALTSHYIAVTKSVKHVLQHRASIIMATLQPLVQARAHVVASLRARLQMTRDVLAGLQQRSMILQVPAADGAIIMGGGGIMTGGGGGGGVAPPDDMALLQTWMEQEDALKERMARCYANSNSHTSIVSGKSTSTSKKPLVWPSTHLEATPSGLPLLLSALSMAPDKSMALSYGAVLGTNVSSSLTWLDTHLPHVGGGGGGGGKDDVATDEQQELRQLRSEVALLEAECTKERSTNHSMSGWIANSRLAHDAAVVAMATARSETETVLWRHNILLESSVAQDLAAAAQYEQHVAASAAPVATDVNASTSTSPLPPSTMAAADNDDDVPSGDGEAPVASVIAHHHNNDDMEDDDDDDDDDDEEEDYEWQHNKREREEAEAAAAMPATSSGSPYRKRRKL